MWMNEKDGHSVLLMDEKEKERFELKMKDEG